MLKERGPQTDFSGTLKGLSRSGLFAFIPSVGLWSAYYIMSRRLRLCVHSGWAVRGIMRCLSLFCQGMFVRNHIQRGRKERCIFCCCCCCCCCCFFLQRAGVDVHCLQDKHITTVRIKTANLRLNTSVWHTFSLSRGDFKVVASLQRLSLSPHWEAETWHVFRPAIGLWLTFRYLLIGQLYSQLIDFGNVLNMSECCEKCSSQSAGAQNEVLPRESSSGYHQWQRKRDKRSWNQLMLDVFCLLA